MEHTIYNQKGETAGKINLPESIFGLPWNADLVHQVVTSMLSDRRKSIANTKTRGEVAGGGKKPWQQKGLGRARHGSIRSPIWVGGGVTHGPRSDKNYGRKVNRKMKAKALFTILSKKLKDGEVLFLNSFAVSSAKTKDAKLALATLGGIKGFEMLSKKRNNAAIIALGEKNDETKRSFNNFSNLEVTEVRNLNPVDLVKYKYVIIANPETTVKAMEAKLS